MNGNYSIEITSENRFLTFTYLGYKAKKMVINNQTIINIKLEELTTNLNEIVITALGVNRKTKELGAFPKT